MELFTVLVSFSTLIFPVHLSPCNMTTCNTSTGECAAAATDCSVSSGCICTGGYEIGTNRPSTTCCCADWAGNTSNCKTQTGAGSTYSTTATVTLDPTQNLTVQVGGSGAALSAVAEKFAKATGVQLSLRGSAGEAHVAPGRYEGTLSTVFESLARGAGARANVSAAAKTVVLER
jgi:hypothetical protein